ncbi:MAG TPA: mechanosensitive ion channel family protein [Saprospiraceae bacterium]|nr:mechanosensitive ion channel family protein [Saprospiraceae bacterium]
MELLANKMGVLAEELVKWAPKLVAAILVLLIGLWIIGGITKMIRRAMEKSGLDKDVIPFLSSLISVILKVMLVLSVAGMVGIETTSFIALIGMAGLAIGMALQGTLGHFASGIMILLFKPYKVGDLIDVQGQLGHVDEIQVFNTIITTLDNKKVIIPNGQATSGTITNLSTNEHLRVDLNVAMPYEEDFDKVQGIIMDALKATPKVMTDPAPVVEIEKFQEHNILLAVRPYATTADYWDVYFGAYKNVKAALGKHGIKVAYPKREVTMANA